MMIQLYHLSFAETAVVQELMCVFYVLNDGFLVVHAVDMGGL